MHLLDKITSSCNRFAARNAFLINHVYYSYLDLSQALSNIRNVIEAQKTPGENLIGVVQYDDLETYASVFAILFSGCAFVPLNPKNPIDRNLEIIRACGLQTILSSCVDHPLEMCSQLGKYRLIDTKTVPLAGLHLSAPKVAGSDLVYLFFTSGSTGQPKGVPITYHNLNNFLDAFFSGGYDIGEEDRFLQMFELTFDLSVMSYMVPLCVGACVYTVDPCKIKYTVVYDLLEEYRISFALMVPSILSFLRSYFEDIRLPSLKYSLFCGEALYNDLTDEWSACVPNASIQNVYGPTECTIFCFRFDWQQRGSVTKSRNGIVCIGRPMKHVGAIVVDDHLQLVGKGKKGELCLTGELLSRGYWKNEEKNAEAFFTQDGHRYYRTGDIALVDDEGDYYYCGRKDQQIQIQGFRVEISEVEHFARAYKEQNVVALAYKNTIGNMQIHLFVEGKPEDLTGLVAFMRTKLPEYMIPAEVTAVEHFPHNLNGKVDRKKLKNLIG